MKKVFIILILLSVSKTYAQKKDADSLKQAIKAAKDDTTKVQLLCQLGYEYTWSYADSAIIYEQEALQLAQKINYPNGIAFSQRDLSDALIVIGNYPQAMDYDFKVLSYNKKAKDTIGLIFSNASIGMCYREQGNYNIGLNYFRTAFKLTKLFHLDKPQMAGLRGMASSIYEKNNQLDSALFYAQKSYEFNKNWSGLLYVLGDIYAKKGNNELALQYFRRTIFLAEKTHAQIDILDSYNGIARVYINKGKIDSAIYYARKALVLKWGKAYPIGVLGASTLLANIYEKKKVTDSTLKYLKLTMGLKDSLYSRQKEREIQNIAFNEQLNQEELLKQQEQAANRLKMYALLGILLIILIIAFLQWRNSRQKQKAYNLLEKQKQEIDLQKVKVEHTLDELKSTQNQLIQSEKMASLGELTAGIAHEIQNPLNFVNNFSEVNQEMIDELRVELKNGNVNEALAIADDIQQNEEKINHHGKRADFIVKGMLQHSRTSTGEKQPTNINVLADEFFKLSYHGLRAKDKSFNAEMITNFDKNLPAINVVQQDMGRVVLNLFNNAFYAVNQKAKTAGANYRPEVTISTSMENSWVIIKVTDNGVGIPDAIKDKIMQPFFTTKPTGEGTGLGLSLTYDMVVKGHGGKIEADSKQGEYTTFTISLPADKKN